MVVKIELDGPSEQLLEQAFGRDIARAALEAMAAEGYRSGQFSRRQVQQLLGLPDRWAAEAWLKARRAEPDLSLDDVLRDAGASRAARESSCSSSPTPRH